MNHIAIDLGGRESQVCVRDEKGTILDERRLKTDRLERYLSGCEKSRVIVETCAEAFAVADASAAHGHETRVVPATLARTLGVGARKLKSDIRDARVLSEVSCRIDLPSVHIPAHRSREWKTRCGMREALIRSRTLLINNVRGWLRAGAIRVRGGGTKTFPQRVRDRIGEQLPNWVERQLGVIETLTVQIQAATSELTELAKQDDVCRRLMTVPGVGPITAIRFVAAVDDVTRFKDAHELESYLGLVPGEHSSSEKRRMTSITKAGSVKARWALVEASWTLWRVRATDPIGQWATQIALRRGRRIAVVALARKLAGVLYAIWRDGSQYEPERAASSRPGRSYRLKAA